MEAKGINKSLFEFGNVMGALDKGLDPNYRNTPITFLLQSALGGKARCMLLFNASPAASNSKETLRTLKSAKRIRDIKLKKKSSAPKSKVPLILYNFHVCVSGGKNIQRVIGVPDMFFTILACFLFPLQE